MTRSAVYEGRVRHRREGPRPHDFGYGLSLFALDLDELPELIGRGPLLGTGRGSLVRYRRADYLGDPEVPLKDAVLDRVALELHARPRGRVVLLSQPRVLGYAFNPVSFYFCHDETDGLVAVVAEITNTPWGERHAYVLDARRSGADARVQRRFRKEFHVSPFFDMDQTYVWRFDELGDELRVEMENHEAGRVVFRVELALRRRPWSTGAALRPLWRRPWQPLFLHAAIYWQALRLWAKRTPFFTHPDKRSAKPGARPS